MKYVVANAGRLSISHKKSGRLSVELKEKYGCIVRIVSTISSVVKGKERKGYGMLFNDKHGLVIHVGSLLIVEKTYHPDLHKHGIRFVTIQGVQDVQYYLSEEIRDTLYEQCIKKWGMQQEEGDGFTSFMQAHAIRGAKLAEERAQKEEKGWE